MAIGAHYIKRDLEDLGILTKAFGLYPHYKFAITGMPAKLLILQTANTRRVYMINLNVIYAAFHFLCIINNHHWRLIYGKFSFHILSRRLHFQLEVFYDFPDVWEGKGTHKMCLGSG